ncbi:Uncharacterized protein FWK35_00037893 [Aphis craccivora]|uniref:Double jelly roll-like domain-containing protein n=1 Tax=Aphis craccivora TaxID=307492 RepID=A0A6G0VV63_APHCR|nr:Uncharacterized protein FWK35_00037893 [Aphis craccivora]
MDGKDNVFIGCIPLKHLFRFCEDNKKILLNCNQQLNVKRSCTDLDALLIDSRKTLSCAFRTCDLCKYPILPRNTSHSWTIKSSRLLEKPRFILLGLQTDR